MIKCILSAAAQAAPDKRPFTEGGYSMQRYLKPVMLALLSAAICIHLTSIPAIQAATPASVYSSSDNSESIPLTDIEISGVTAPTAGEIFDTTAKVKASDGTTWNISVFWLSTQEVAENSAVPADTAKPLAASDGSIWEFSAYRGKDSAVSAVYNVTAPDGSTHTLPIYPIQTSDEKPVPAEDNTVYVPLLVFYLPEGYTCDGQVILDDFLSGVFYMTGGAVSIIDAETGFTYITGKVKAADGQDGNSDESNETGLTINQNPLLKRPESIIQLNPTNIPSLSSVLSSAY